MFEKVTQKPFVNRLKDTGFLFKNSFKVVGKSVGIIKPTIYMIIFSIILTTIFFGSLFTFFINRYISMGIIALVFLVFILTPFKFFYYVREKATQSWMVYNAITGKEINYRDAYNYTGLQKSSLRKISLIEILSKYVGSQRDEKRGIGAFLINLFLASLVEIWDLLSHYMIPAVVIEKKLLKEIIPEIKSLRANVPAVLAGVFGIDFAGNVISVILSPIYLFIIAIGAGAGYLFVSILPNTVLTIGNFSFSWVPVFVSFYFVFVAGTIIKKIIESIKIIYFTIFYTAIKFPSAITQDAREELTHYLLMEESVERKIL